MGEKYGTPVGLAMLAYLMMSDYQNATPEEQEQIIDDAIDFAEKKLNNFNP